jgi:hypothetical protein
MTARALVGLALLLVVVGVIASRPLAVEWADGLPLAARGPVLTHAPGDTLQLYYQLWLVADGLAGRTPLFRDPYQFRIDGPRFNLPQAFLPLSLPFALLTPWLGSHAAYSLLVVLSFPAAGLAAFALVRHYTGHLTAAAAAGVVYACLPARLGPLFGGHPAGFAAALIPLVLWGLDLALARASLAGALAGGTALLAIAMLEPHYTYFAGGLLLLYLPVRWLTLPAPRRVAPVPLVAFGALAAAGAGWLFMLRQAFLVGSVAEAGRGLDVVRLYAPGLAALGDGATYGSWAALAIGLVGLGAPGPRSRGLACFYGVVLATGVVLSLGPGLAGVPLYEQLHRRLPLFALIRNPEKFRLLASLGVTVLAGFGVRALVGRLSPRAARPAGLALVAGLLLATVPWHAIALTRFPATPIYAALRARAGRVLHVPLFAGDNMFGSVYLYTVTRTHVPMLNGYSPLVPRRYAQEVGTLERLNVGDLGPAEHALLRRLGVSHVLLDRALFPPKVSPFPSAYTRDRLRASPGLALETAADPLWLFRVTDRAPGGIEPRPTSPVGVFFEAEWLSTHAPVVAEAAASGGHAVATRPGTASDFVVFGPYQLLPAGDYRARFRVRGSGLTCEVTTDEGRSVLASRALPPLAAWDEAELAFPLAVAAPVEYRVRWDGRGEAAVDWVSVVAAERPDPEWTFEVEDLPHRLGERPDPAASGGWAGYAHPAESLRADLVGGPRRLYPPGAYRLTLRARGEGLSAGPLVRLAVSEPIGRQLAERVVDAAELPPGRYRDVSLDFRLAAPAVLEFPIGYLGGTGVFFDRIVVTPR